MKYRAELAIYDYPAVKTPLRDSAKAVSQDLRKLVLHSGNHNTDIAVIKLVSEEGRVLRAYKATMEELRKGV